MENEQALSERLQVMLTPGQMKELKREARATPGLTVAFVVRRRLFPPKKRPATGG